MSKTGSPIFRRLWILCFLLVSCVPSSGVLHFDDKGYEVGTDIKESMQFGDREYVRSVFQQVFDLTANDAAVWSNTIDSRIKSNLGFGGSCDPYAGVRRLVPRVSPPGFIAESDYPEKFCLAGNEPEASSNSVRNGYLAAACTDLVIPDTSKWNVWSEKASRMGMFLRVMNKIDPEFILIENGAKVPDRFRPTADSVRKAYRLFHVIRDPDPTVLDALLTLADETKEMSSDNSKTYWYRAWQYILFSVCVDPAWQAISI